MARRPGRPAALGFSVHTGWAALVAVAAEPGGVPAIVDRRRLELIAGNDPTAPRFVFHAARERALDAARLLVRESEERARAAANTALRGALDALAAQGLTVVAGAVPRGGRPPPPALEAILASHTLLHAAEGALFRDAIQGALAAAGLAVVDLPVKEVAARAAAALGLSPGQVPRLLVQVGAAAGRPWAKDQKDAYLAACLGLVA